MDGTGWPDAVPDRHSRRASWHDIARRFCERFARRCGVDAARGADSSRQSKASRASADAISRRGCPELVAPRTLFSGASSPDACCRRVCERRREIMSMRSGDIALWVVGRLRHGTSEHPLAPLRARLKE